MKETIKRAGKAALYSESTRRLLRRNPALASAVMRGVLEMDPDRENTGWSDEASYCYSVFLRHLQAARQADLNTNPSTIVEVGPGDSLGIGLCGVLTGADRLYALDAFRYANVERTLNVFDGLVELLTTRAAIPDNTVYPEVEPSLSDYSFPSDVLDDARLERSLRPERLEAIREAISAGMNGAVEGRDIVVSYFAPWSADTAIPHHEVDLIISQAAMEHVADLPLTYRSCSQWLSPTGHLSFQVDFRCHGTAPDWNGHWSYSSRQWSIVQNSKTYRWINRQPASEHERLIRANELKLVATRPNETHEGIERRHLHARWRHLSDDDLRRFGALFLATLRTSDHGAVKPAAPLE